MGNLKSYRERLKIAADVGDKSMQFLTKCDMLIANGYERVVIGARGPYIEFTEHQIVRENILVPTNEIWRISSDVSFYIEYRTNDVCNVKIYFQKKLVNYADYKIDYYYISPFDLKTHNLDYIILPLKQVPQTDNIFF